MSGGVGPPCDISLPKDEPHTHTHPTAPTPSSTVTRRGSHLSFRQLNAAAVVIILSASGMVTLQDVATVLFSLLYFAFISRVAFPPTKQDSIDSTPPVFQTSFLTAYAFAGAIIGLFLPVAYICEGIYEGDKEGIRAAAPHMFLLSSQVFVEGVARSAGFSLPVRVLVPVFYNSVRVLSVMEWLQNELAKCGGGSGSERRVAVGRGLAVVNMAFWSFNLFGFLLPFYMPKAFKMYYSKIKD